MKFCFDLNVVAILRRAALALLLGAAAGPALAVPVHVSLDTSGFGVSSGFVDMQLSASAGVPLAGATVTNMVGFDTSGFIDAYGVAAVPGGYRFQNDTLNDLFHAAHFGGMVSFDLTFAGQPDPLTQFVSHFIVSAFDVNYMPLGNYDPVTLALVDFGWTPSPGPFGEGTIGIGISDPLVTVVPEPADLLLMGAGLAALVVVMQARPRRAGRRGQRLAGAPGMARH